MKPRPRIRKMVKWVGAAVTALLVVVWVASGWFSVDYFWGSTWHCRICGGILGFELRPMYLPPSRHGWDVDTSSIEWPAPEWDWAFDHNELGNYRSFDIPLWALIAVCLPITGAVWRLDTVARRRARLSRCPKCNYDRAGLEAGVVCPECGSKPL